MIRRRPGQLQSPYGLLALTRANRTNAQGDNTTGLELIHSPKLSKALGPPNHTIQP